jgi:hypothetical protein
MGKNMSVPEVLPVFKEIQVQPEKVFEMLFSPESKDLQI